jgi:hypothetical protein
MPVITTLFRPYFIGVFEHWPRYGGAHEPNHQLTDCGDEFTRH